MLESPRRGGVATRCRALDGGSIFARVRPERAEGPMEEEEEQHGKVDLVSILYIVGGIPMIVLFLVVLFGFARSCNIPA